MAAKLYNLARMYTDTTTTGPLHLTNAVPPFLTFAQAGVQDGDQVHYAINDFVNGGVEEGLGTFSSPATISRDTVFRSSGAGNTGKITLSGRAEVGISPAAEFFTPLDAAHGGTGVANDVASTLTIAGAFALTLTIGGVTSLTLPAAGTLATLGGIEELTNKTLTAAVAKGVWTASGTWTVPAHTLAGTVSGGGNQINNVIIGTSTPLAGSFTALTATTGTFSSNIHLPNNVSLQARNAANSADVDVAYLDPSNVFQIGGGLPVTVAGGGLTLGTAGSIVGSVSFLNATSGSIKVQPPTGALGSAVLTLPLATDTLIGKATTDTLTNKTYDTAAAGNSFSINGLAATANTGTGSVVRATSPSIASLTVTSAFTATGLVTNADLTNSTLVVGNTTLTLGATATGLTFLNNQVVGWRNAANSVTINAAYLDTSNVFQLGGGGNVAIAATTGSSSSSTGALQVAGGIYAGAQSLFGGKVGIANTAPPTSLSVGAKVTDDNSFSYDTNALLAVHQTPTATATLNDPKTALMLARQGTAGQSYGAAAAFNLSRYENSSANSRTRLDISLAHASFDPTSNTIMTLLSSGHVGIGTTVPATIGSGTGLAVGISGGASKIFVTPYVDTNATTSALVVQVVDQAAASTNGGTGYEYAVVGGIKSTHSDGSLAPNKVAVMGTAELSGSTSGNGWGGYFLVSLDSGSRAGSIATGVEIDAINSTTTDRNYTNLGSPSYGLQITGTSNKTNTAAILLSGAAGVPQWYAGIAFNNSRSTSQDYGIDFAFDASNTFGVTAMRLPNNQTIAWKQSGGSNANMLYLDGSDVFQIGGGLPIHIASTTASSSNTTGALTVTGGVGIGGALNIGGAVRADAGIGIGGAVNTAPGFANTTTGIDISNNNYIAISRAIAGVMFVNTNADGTGISMRRSGTEVGSISVTTTATAFNTSSDRDRKEDERPYRAARRVIDDTQIWDFRWMATEERGVGVFAQDAYRIFPDAITPSDEPGGWQADYSKYVPVLIADAQETHRLLAALEARTAAIDQCNAQIAVLKAELEKHKTTAPG